MDKKISISLTVVMAIIVLALGFILGFVLKPQDKNMLMYKTALEMVSSKVITSISAYGIVSNINGKTITLDNLGESLNIEVPASARIFAFYIPDNSDSENVAPEQKTVDFSTIKVGDKVNASVSLLQDLKIGATSVVILPLESN